MKAIRVPNFYTYVPAGVSADARELFRAGVKVAIRKFSDAEKKHGWRDHWMTASREQVTSAFHEHVAKGDPCDVIIYCLIMIARGWTIK